MSQIETSGELDQLAAALAKAQADIDNPTKNANNQFYDSNYADLAQVLSVVRPAFSKHGLSVVQLPGIVDGGYVRVVDDNGKAMVSGTACVTTMLMHESGQWISSQVHAPVLGTNPSQELGKVVTYLRRYSLAAFAGVAQVDEDGNDERQRHQLPSRLPPEPRARTTAGGPPASDSVNDVQLLRMRELIESTGSDELKLCEHYKVSRLEDMPARNYSTIMDILRSKQPANAADAEEPPPEPTP